MLAIAERAIALSARSIDIYAFGREAAPLVAECKARGNGGGFVQLERWLGQYDLLVLKRNYADPLVLLPWRVWARLTYSLFEAIMACNRFGTSIGSRPFCSIVRVGSVMRRLSVPSALLSLGA